MAQLFNSYADPIDFLANASMNVETGSLVGLNTTLYAAVAAGASSIQLSSNANAPTAFPATLWLLDGATSEQISVASITGSVAPFTATLANGTTLLAAHTAGISVSSAGSAGCLASVLARASAAVEAICKQGPDASSDRSLYQKSRTERLSGPSAYRAAFDADHSLILMPYRFPVASVASLSVQMGAQTAQTIDTTFLYLPDAAKRIIVPWAQIAGSPPNLTSYFSAPFPRAYGFVATLTYTAGPCAGTTLDTVPYNVKEATYLLAADLLSFRVNPTGAAEVRRGNVSYTTRLRGDTSGKNILQLRAEDLLSEYINK